VPLLLLNPLVAAYTAVFRAFGHLRRTAALNVAMLAAQTALTVVALGLGWGVAGAMLANVASSGAQALAAHRLYRRDRLPTSPETVAAWGLVRACWPFALAAVLAALQMRMGTVLSEAWAGAATAGLYAAAYRFIEAGRLIPQAAFDALLPALSASREHPERFAGLARRVGVRVAGYGVLFAIGCAVLGGWAVPWAFGAPFAPAGDLLRWVGLAALPMAVKYWAGVVWIARGQERRVTTLNALALAAQAAYSAALIPAYGLSGAGAALLLGELTGAVLLGWRIALGRATAVDAL
jgi:O-antigen/teichoic acid export membrane protein